jgi:hypothetical protein
MKNFKKDLIDAAKAAKALALKIEKLQKQFAEMEKKHPKMPVKKASAKKVVKPAAKKTVAKKKAVTATDAVLGIINRSKKGVDVAGLKKKTGYKDRKIYDIVKTLKKRGKIKTPGKGIYVKV